MKLTDERGFVIFELSLKLHSCIFFLIRLNSKIRGHMVLLRKNILRSKKINKNNARMKIVNKSNSTKSMI